MYVVMHADIPSGGFSIQPSNNQQIQLWKPYLTTAVTKEMGLILGIGFDLIRQLCLD